jgi:hypothetical protein
MSCMGISPRSGSIRSSRRRAATDAANAPCLHVAGDLGQRVLHRRVGLESLLQAGLDAGSHIQAWSCCWRRAASRPLAVCSARKRVMAAQKGSASARALAHALSCMHPGSRCQTCWSWCRWSGLPCSPNSRSALVICARARVAAASSRSALLMTTRSASSITPFLMACRSSPALGSCSSTKHVGHAGHRGLALAHAHGLDDDDIVPGGLAHQHRLARLLGHAAQRAAAGAGTDVGAGRPCQPLPCASCRRGWSRPRSLDDGSTASTATRWPRAIRNRPSASMKVLLPTPGTPLMPRRKLRPLCGSRAFSRHRHARGGRRASIRAG